MNPEYSRGCATIFIDQCVSLSNYHLAVLSRVQAYVLEGEILNLGMSSGGKDCTVFVYQSNEDSLIFSVP
jgi:hypothetical protein